MKSKQIPFVAWYFIFFDFFFVALLVGDRHLLEFLSLGERDRIEDSRKSRRYTVIAREEPCREEELKSLIKFLWHQ